MTLIKDSVRQIDGEKDFQDLLKAYPVLIGKLPRVSITTKKANISKELLEMCGEQVDGIKDSIQHFEQSIIGTKKQTLCFVYKDYNPDTLHFSKQNLVSLLNYYRRDTAAEQIKTIIIISQYQWFEGNVNGNRAGDNFSIVICEVTDSDRTLIKEIISEL